MWITLKPTRPEGHDGAATPSAVREKVASWTTTQRVPPWNIRRVPMLGCPHCGVRQYAAVSYVEHPDCVACGMPLGRAGSLALATASSAPLGRRARVPSNWDSLRRRTDARG